MITEHDAALKMIMESRLVAILRGVPADRADGVVQALIDGGVRVLEFTFDHDRKSDLEENAEKIRRTVEKFGDRVIVGCGTALTREEIDAAYRAGAVLAVMPNTDRSVIERARENGMVAMPGAFTPTETVEAWKAGADIVKLFPAGELGPAYIKALRGPLGFIPMSAVGGIEPGNAGAFLDAGVCGLGVGSKMILPAAVRSGDDAAIRQRAKAFTDAIREWERKK